MELKYFIGWDPRDYAAYSVTVESLLAHASIPVKVIPLVDNDLRRRGHYWRSYRVDHRGQMWDDIDGKPFSTQFSFSRFAVPIIQDYKDEWVLFTDADMMWRADIAELVKSIDDTKAVMVVKHDHRPRETEKMDGVLQTTYERKNWSSVFLMNPSKCRHLTKYAVNNWPGSSLHAFNGLDEEEIGTLGEEWNWLEGHSPPAVDPKLVHYTRGTPDMEGHEISAYSDEWREYYKKSASNHPLSAYDEA